MAKIINGIRTNSEAWYRLLDSEQEVLLVDDELLMRNIFILNRVHSNQSTNAPGLKRKLVPSHE